MPCEELFGVGLFQIPHLRSRFCLPSRPSLPRVLSGVNRGAIYSCIPIAFKPWQVSTSSWTDAGAGMQLDLRQGTNPAVSLAEMAAESGNPRGLPIAICCMMTPYCTALFQAGVCAAGVVHATGREMHSGGARGPPRARRRCCGVWSNKITASGRPTHPPHARDSTFLSSFVCV